jgi:hypothetical protein
MLQRGHHKVVLQLGLKGMQQKETEASKPFQASRIHPRTAYGAHTCTPPGRVGGRASRAVAGRPHVGAAGLGGLQAARDGARVCRWARGAVVGARCAAP